MLIAEERHRGKRGTRSSRDHYRLESEEDDKDTLHITEENSQSSHSVCDESQNDSETLFVVRTKFLRPAIILYASKAMDQRSSVDGDQHRSKQPENRNQQPRDLRNHVFYSCYAKGHFTPTALYRFEISAR